MPTRETTRRRRLFRIGSAVALLLAGAMVLTVGGAGLLSDLFRSAGTPLASAQTIAFGIAALVPLVVFVGVTVTTTRKRHPRRVAVGGALFAAGTVGGSLLLGSGQPAPATFEGPLATALSVGYVLGLVLVLGALIDGIQAPKTRPPTRTEEGWQATSRSMTHDPTRSGTVPADGGSEDSDLAFPLDTDDEEKPDDGR